MNTSSGYFDLQVNGYGGVDFNQDALTAEALHSACAKLHDDGVGGILATIITEKLELMCARLRRLIELRERDPLAKGIIAGIHVEGPFLSTKPGYPGAHPIDSIVPANVDAAKQLQDACGGLLKLFTLAPECDAGLATTRMFSRAGVVVSAGHTDASLDELKAAIDAGLTMVTHVGNGCPSTGMHRHDNIVQRSLHLRRDLWLCFIADMVHVPQVALRNYFDLLGVGTGGETGGGGANPDAKVLVVTDAIAPAGLGPGRYTMGRWDLLIGDDMVARSPDGSHFVGAAITMAQSHANLRERLGLGENQCRRLLVDNPRRAVGLPA